MLNDYDYYADQDYLSEAYGPTAKDAAYFGETDHVYTMLEDGDITEEEARKMIGEINGRYQK